MANDPAFFNRIPTVFCWEEAPAGSRDGLSNRSGVYSALQGVQRCVKPVHGSHKESSSHEPTGHRSV